MTKWEQERRADVSGSRSRPLGPPPDLQIPDKLYFKIGEVADLVGVQPHVLRYWEKEIPAIRPLKSSSNQRRYRRSDVEVFREVRRLLYEERFTLEGAKKRLTAGKSRPAEGAEPEPAPPAAQTTRESLSDSERDALAAARSGLRDLIRQCGEEP